MDCRLRVEVGSAMDYLYYPDGRIARSMDIYQTLQFMKSWRPNNLNRWQRAVIWIIGIGPVTIVDARRGIKGNLPPKWLLRDK